jgi:hypothetical protein
MPRVKFAVQSYESRSLPLSAQKLVNFYAEAAPEDAHTQAALFGTPGLKLFATVGVGPIRGMIEMDELLFVVSGGRIFSVGSTGLVNLIGDIGGTAPVDMAHNGEQIFVRTGGDDSDSFIVTTTTVTQISDADFVGASSVTFQDGFFIYTETDSGRFYISAADDGTSWDALDFATAEGDPDDAVRIFSDHRELWVFGRKSVEIWYNSGEADFPFARASGAYLERGLGAAGSVAKVDNTVYWLGDNRIVYRAEGYTPKRISNHGIEALLTKLDSVSDLRAFEYSQEGHQFYVLTKPDEFTVVYDVATGYWHHRKSLNRSDWRVHTHAFVYGKNIVGDAVSGKLYELDLETYDEDGAALISTAITPTIWGETNRTIMSRFQVDMEAGVGLTDGQGDDPQMMLRWSNDGGRTWSNELWASMGKKGEYKQSAEWRRLGMFERRIMEVSISDPVKRVLLGGYADFVEGRGSSG